MLERITLLFVAMLLAGCVPIRPEADLASRVANTIGDPIAITVFDDGGQLDVLPWAPGFLKLPDAVRLAVQSDSDVQVALARVRAAEADADQSRLLPNPILTVALRFPESTGKPIIEAGLTAEFISLLTRTGRVGAADNRLRAAAAEAVTTVLTTLAEVRERYAAVQALDALMPVLEARRNLISKLLKLAHDRLDAGEGTRLDITTLDAQRLELEVEIAEKRVERWQERMSLARMIGRPSGSIDWLVSAWEEPMALNTSESAWVEMALACRPEIEAERWELAALGVEYRLTRFAIFETADAGMVSERDAEWTLGPTVTVPLLLFDWGQAKAAKANALRLEAAHKLTKARRIVVEEVRKSYAEFDAARSTLELVRTQLLPAQQQRRDQTEAAYKSGQTDITALIIADQDFQSAHTKLIELQRKTASALIRLERAVGGPAMAARIPATQAAPPPSSRPAASTPDAGHPNQPN